MELPCNEGQGDIEFLEVQSQVLCEIFDLNYRILTDICNMYICMLVHTVQLLTNAYIRLPLYNVK